MPPEISVHLRLVVYNNILLRVEAVESNEIHRGSCQDDYGKVAEGMNYGNMFIIFEERTKRR